MGITKNEIKQVFWLGTLHFLQLWGGILDMWLCPNLYLAERFLLCRSARQRVGVLCRERRDVFMVFSCLPWWAACFWAVQLQIPCVRLQTPQKNSWEISEAAEQSGYNRNKKTRTKQNKKNLIERKLSEAAPWCPFTLRHCPGEPPGKWQDIFFPDNNVKKKHKKYRGQLVVSLCFRRALRWDRCFNNAALVPGCK